MTLQVRVSLSSDSLLNLADVHVMPTSRRMTLFQAVARRSGEMILGQPPLSKLGILGVRLEVGIDRSHLKCSTGRAGG